MTYFQDSKTGYFHPIEKIPDWVSNRSYSESQGGDIFLLPLDEEYTARYIEGQWSFKEI